MYLSKIISPIQSPSSTPVVSSRVLYDVQRKRNNARVLDNLWDTDNQYCYVGNGSWGLYYDLAIMILLPFDGS